ncbi:MAG: fibronectin type III domain-containing protein [Bacteroidales bacterium]|nr:fibronectin type III domain-containing protein [Bacteroidales bacterium]
MFFKTFTRFFLLIGMISLLSTPLRADEIQIGSGSQTDSNLPTHSNYNYSLTQQIYTAAEIETAGGGAGSINSIAFYNTGSAKTRTVDIYLVNTSKDTFSGYSDWITVSENDKVFSGSVTFNANQWTTIPFSTTFSYDGTNLAVIVDDNTNSYSSGLSCRIFTASETQSNYYRYDYTNPNPTNPTISGTPTTNKNQIILDIEMATVTCSKPKNFQAESITAHTATLTWTAGAESQSNWEVYLTTTANDVPDENTTPTYQVTSCSKALSDLTAQTTYYAYVRANCGDGDKSKWANKTFSTTREALTVDASHPYEQDFESSNDWGFTNGNLTNNWCWGSATNNGGAKAMYVSKDGGTTYEYADGNTTIYASKLFNFSQGTYTFVFDWQANGESTYDFMRVALIPGDMELEAGTTLPSGVTASALPSNWISLDGGKLNLQSSWQTRTAEAAVSGTYTMVFLWRNDFSGGTQPPAAIDNISISLMACPRPTGLTASNIGGRTATIAWTENGTATNWVLQYATNNGFTENVVETNVSGTATQEITGLTSETQYFVRVKSIFGNEESSWSDVINFTTTATCQKPNLSYVANSNTAHTGAVSWTGSADHYELIYSTAYSFNPGDEGVTQIDLDNVNTYTLQDLTPETTYRVKIRAYCGEEDGYSAWSNQVNFTTTATCVAPSGLSATATATTITLNWTAGANDQNAWDIRYKSSSDSDYTLVHLDNQTTTSYTITGLNPVTTYNVNVRAYCSAEDQSKWGYSTNQNADLSVNTECAALPLPYSYGFEDNLNTASPYSSSYPMPNCWNAIRYQYGNYPSYTYYPYVCSTTNNSNYGPRTGGKFLLLYKTQNLTNEIAVLPELEANIKNVQLRFWGRNGNGSSAYPEVLVGIMTDPTIASTFTQVKSVSVSTADYQEYTVDFSSYTGDGIYIAFKLNPAYSSYSYTYFSIDDITIEEIPSCLVPTGLEANVNGANEATLSWAAGGTETTWNVQYKSISDSDWSEPIAVNETSYTLTGLQRATAYEARVQASCDTEDQSEWSNPISFETECGIWTIDAANPLVEDFNDETFPPTCWQKVNFGEMGVTNGWLRNTNNNLDNQGAVTSDFKYETWLFLPQMHLDGDATLAFDNLFTSGSNYVPCSIMVSTTPHIDVEDIKTEGFIEANFTQIWLADENNLPTSKTNEVVTLNDYNGEDVYIAFRYEGNNSNSQIVWWIDNVVIQAEAIHTETNQTINLVEGWNWFSTSLDITLDDLKAALVEALGNTNITITSGNGQSTIYNGSRWRGYLTSLDPTQMYKIETSAAGEMTLTGEALDPTEHPITITLGNNWIAYPFNESMTITNAFAGFAINGDMITSGNGLSTTYNGRWRGYLTDLEPGQGYIYKSNDTDDRTFVFPTGNKSLASSKAISSEPESHWSDFVSSQYKDQLPVVSFIQLDGNFITAESNWEDLEIAAFVDDECRGHAFMHDETEFGDPYPHVMVGVFYNNPDEAVTFKMYDHSTRIEYDNCISNMELLTGHEHIELYFDYDEAVVLNYISPVTPVFTKDIIGYGEGKGRYYLIATPIDDMNPTDVEGMIAEVEDDYDLYWFDQTQDLEWRNYKQGEGFNLVSGMGYLYANKVDTTLVFSGNPYEGEGIVSLVYDAEAHLPGWNLVGNPFTDTAFIDRPFYRMNALGTEINSEPETGGIAPMEGVFVITETDGEELVFSTTDPNAKNAMVALNLSKNYSVIDRAIIRFDEGRTLPKIQLNPNHSKIYISQDGKDYAVVNAKRDDVSTISTMDINFKAETNGTYTLTVSESLNSKLLIINYLHLIDNLTGTDIDLLQTPSYSFEARSTDYAQRFKLVFATDNASNDNDNFAYISNGEIIVDGEGILQIFDVQGHEILRKNLSPLNSHLSPFTSPGIYTLRLINGNNVRTQKIVIE